MIADKADIDRFVIESNKIEGITRKPTGQEIVATEAFLLLDYVKMDHLETFVSICQPGAKLRIRNGMNVRVGDHIAPAGGPGIGYSLGGLLLKANEDSDPFETHVEYETLHPFTDGNGRSGRVLWAWQMLRQDRGIKLGFLHSWYYQSLSARRKNE